MDLAALLGALREERVDGHRIASWSVHATETKRVAIGTKDAETGNPHAPLALSEALTARFKIVWDDRRVSRAALERRQVEREPSSAIRAARASAYDDSDALDVLGPSVFPEVAIHEPRVAAIAAGAVEPFIPRLEAIRGRVRDRGLKTWSGSFQAAEGNARVVTSAGLDVHGRGTSSSWHVTFDGELGVGHTGRASEEESDFLARIDRVVLEVLALRREASRGVGGLVPVLLHPDVVEEYVLGALLHNLDGAQVAHGTGAFRREQFGADDPVFREDLTLRNDPLIPMAAGAYRFTHEGVPARRVTLVDHGRLATPLLDLKYARRLGRTATPSPSAMDTLFLEGPAPLTYETALGRTAGGGLVLSVLGVHTQDFTSGDFSISAPQTLAVGEDGIEGRLRATLSGNLFELLRSPELDFVRFPGEHTPGLLVRCRLESTAA